MRLLLARNSSYKIKRDHGGISAITMEIPTRLVDVIARMPGVLSVSKDVQLTAAQAAPPVSGELLQQTLGRYLGHRRVQHQQQKAGFLDDEACCQ